MLTSNPIHVILMSQEKLDVQGKKGNQLRQKERMKQKPLKSLSNFTMLVGKNLIFFAVG